MANTVNKIKRNMDIMRGNMGEIKDKVGEIKGTVGEIKDNMGEIKDDVGEIKCLCSFTCRVSITDAHAKASPQGTRSNRTFENGSPRRTRPQITTPHARPTKRELPRGSFKVLYSRSGN